MTGKCNRERRAVKQRKRQAASRSRGAAGECAEQLGGPLSPVPERVLHQATGSVLTRTLALVWDAGWQPQDVQQIIRRRLSALHVSLAVDLLADEAARYSRSTVDHGIRIGERLAGAAEVVEKDVVGVELLPVLVADRERLNQAREALFPKTVERSVAVSSYQGYAAGRAAADLAQLDQQLVSIGQDRAAS